MSDIPQDPELGWNVAKSAWGILISILGVLGLSKLKQIGKHEDEINKLKASVVTKDDFMAFQQLHTEKLDELRESMVGSISCAVDQLEKSRREAMTRIHETQDLILRQLMEKK